MAYTPTDWTTGDAITAAALDHIETGIDEAHTAIDGHMAAMGLKLASGKQACSLTATGTDFTVSFGTTFANAPQVVISPEFSNTNQEIRYMVHTITTTGFKIHASRGANASVTFHWVAHSPTG